jgi:glycosyltransferase involved in cell wall biosynthesis
VVERDLKPLAAGRPVFRSELPVFDFYAHQSASATASRTSSETAEAAPEAASRAVLKQEFGFAAEDDVLLFFGYVRAYKGLDVLLRALPAVRRHRPSVKLLVAGEFYDDPQRYADLTAELGLSEHVKIINRFIPNEEVRRFYAVSDVVVQPYRSATQSGILNVAYGFGLPAVVTRVGGLEEYMTDGKTGTIAEPNSPESLAEAVLRFYALRESVDFAAEVRRKAAENSFGRVHEVFAEVLRFVQSTR